MIRDNLFMLEIDPRCTQIAAFALALAAWKTGGYRPLPVPNIACSGIAVTGQFEDWLRLAGGDERMRTALERLYRLFRDAPTLGSLINPADVPLNERLFSADYEEVAPLLEKALAKGGERSGRGRVGRSGRRRGEGGKVAGAVIHTGSHECSLPDSQASRTKSLATYLEQHHPEAKADLATAFVERCQAFTSSGGTYALVTPQNWLFLRSYSQAAE